MASLLIRERETVNVMANRQRSWTREHHECTAFVVRPSRRAARWSARYCTTLVFASVKPILTAVSHIERLSRKREVKTSRSRSATPVGYLAQALLHCYSREQPLRQPGLPTRLRVNRPV